MLNKNNKSDIIFCLWLDYLARLAICLVPTDCSSRSVVFLALSSCHVMLYLKGANSIANAQLLKYK